VNPFGVHNVKLGKLDLSFKIRSVHFLSPHLDFVVIGTLAVFDCDLSEFDGKRAVRRRIARSFNVDL
jgi:hypothetical protein